ncbi:hypothetical protein AB0F11_20375 [Streptomyces sp. NPDC032472]|uniref:hypothetical protein n=1 Tax=Streptomyces sp. NPDC032472 TaxID=3155018 RepID=UPI0033D1DB08
MAGVAGATFGLMPVSGAFAAEHTQVPQNNRWCDDYWYHDDWRDCCWNGRSDRYDRCWDVDSWSGYRHDNRYDNWYRDYSYWDRGGFDNYNHHSGYDSRYDYRH